MSTLRETFTEAQIEHMVTSPVFNEAIAPKRARELEAMFAEDLSVQEATELGRSLAEAVDAGKHDERVSPFWTAPEVSRRGK